jgi:Flp pilus assembly protein TadG
MIFDGIKKAETSIAAISAGIKGARGLGRRFAREDDGVMTYFSFMMLFMMLIIGGIGVDLMHNEMQRTKLQATVDRAVLAAADLDQELDPSEVVNDYFTKAGVEEFLSEVNVNEGLNFRTVEAVASSSTETRFMKFMGVDELPVPAVGTAEEKVSNVEISMVLDISGSMSQNNKMANLRDAANTFIDEVLKPSSANLISINLVPYTAQVNVGEDIFEELAAERLHPYSSCVDFDASDFTSPTISLSKEYDHMQHFEAGWNWSFPIGNPGCPQQAYEEVTAYSQSPVTLKQQVGQFTPRANTSIHLGMKWGVAMLDPSFRPITQALNSSGKVDAAFSSRPVSHSDTDTLKTIILMTDGQNVDTYRIQPWYYANASHRTHWSRYPLFWYLNNYVGGSWSNWYYTKYSASSADGMLDNICNAAKDKGIVVWSVGFEVTNYSASVMQDCASSPSHFFRVEGVEIEEAFQAIAKQINQLRLTQ